MKSNKLFLQFLGFTISICNICYSQTIDETQAAYKNKSHLSEIAKSEDLIKQLMLDKHIPGLSVCVATKSNIIWAEGFGYADIENKVPVKIKSKFRIGSISKTLTGLALSKLIDDHKINLSDNIEKYLDYFPNKNHPITVGELSSHTAGIRDYNYRKNEFTSDQRYNSVKESIGIFKDDTLLFAPGTKYSYSTYGYVLLSAVIETAAKKDFLSYMRDDILMPLNLQNTVPDNNDSIISFRARFYDELKGKLINGIHVDNSNKWAGGGFLSTSYDLTKMAQILLNKQFLTISSIENLWKPFTLPNGQQVKYGIGWKIDADSLQRKYVYHGGSSMGGTVFHFSLSRGRICGCCNMQS